MRLVHLQGMILRIKMTEASNLVVRNKNRTHDNLVLNQKDRGMSQISLSYGYFSLLGGE
ncbi:hypothetical protein BLGI_3069 [Brevibacillus laterosporus GI-9]|uniref:hypothetical protein n=1 Tax=Brevibacillus laterosporus TaxID=1465 RepID=UPI0002403C2B|nr:hypothetical protein [Brevibacillus laterosporus]CCF15128.1 hypothetical protein BLGI_3069 [Brevibacillus laterosporus GI-9]